MVGGFHTHQRFLGHIMRANLAKGLTCPECFAKFDQRCHNQITCGREKCKESRQKKRIAKRAGKVTGL